MNKILIVEDQAQSLYLLNILLSGHGYQVMEAENGAVALEIARADPPALIISDILMPVMDGFALCKAWKSDQQLKDIPFVFYTATYTDPKDEELALRLGAARFIVKPTETEEFISIVEQVISEVESGVVVTPQESLQENTAYYRMYNESLIRKLEDKMLQLEKVNSALQEDILKRENAEREISRLFDESQRRLKQLEALHSIDITISASMDLRMTLNILLKYVETLLNVDAADILLLNPHSQQFSFAAGRGFRTSGVERTSVHFGSSFAKQSALSRKTIVLSKEEVTQVDSELLKPYEREGFLTYVGAPLVAKGQLKGVLQVYYRSHYRPESEWLHLLETLAGQAAIAIDIAQLFNDLQRSNLELTMAYDATITGWSRAMDLRDREIREHTQRVTDLTLKLAQAMNVAPSQLMHIRHGALLHDIGKMGVPDSILLKADTLTDKEWEQMRRHPVLAFEMLSSIQYLQAALDIPYCHHEKWDGSGYPRGLRGQEIPIAARIFAVVDVWDALTSDRPYRKAWSKEAALSYIREQSEKHFDPQVVKEFLLMISGE